MLSRLKYLRPVVYARIDRCKDRFKTSITNDHLWRRPLGNISVASNVF